MSQTALHILCAVFMREEEQWVVGVLRCARIVCSAVVAVTIRSRSRCEHCSISSWNNQSNIDLDSSDSFHRNSNQAGFFQTFYSFLNLEGYFLNSIKSRKNQSPFWCETFRIQMEKNKDIAFHKKNFCVSLHGFLKFIFIFPENLYRIRMHIHWVTSLKLSKNLNNYRNEATMRPKPSASKFSNCHSISLNDIYTIRLAAYWT